MPSLLESYTSLRSHWGSSLSEAPTPRPRGELELQARFYAGEFGLAWTALDGESVEVVHLGEWNREPGPDYIGAHLRIDGRDVRGDIELDREDLDWEHHGHASNPAFDNVVLHVFFKAGRKRYHTRTHQNQSVVDVLLPPIPAQRRPVPPPSTTHGNLEGAEQLVEAAARFRMAKKRGFWLRAVALHGLPEALFQAVAAGLGYKSNKIPFLLVAQRAALARARGPDGEALLFGIAGFLEAGSFDCGGSEMRGYARRLWDAWWRIRDREGRLQIPAEAWNFSALRPANHPHRRLGALASLARNFSPLQKAVETSDRDAFFSVLAKLEHPFWSHHASLAGRPLARPCALVGAQRAADLAANIFAPALGGDSALAVLRDLKPGSPVGKVNRAAAWLGISAQAPWLQTALARQGLLQVYEDFHPTPAGEVIESLFRQGRNLAKVPTPARGCSNLPDSE